MKAETGSPPCSGRTRVVYPAMTPLSSKLFTRAVGFLGERLSRWGWAGTLVSLGGAALIAMGEAGSIRLDPGALLVLLGAVSGAGYFTLQKAYLDRYSALELTSYAMWAGTLLLGVAWGVALPEQIRAAPWDATLAVAYIGVLPGALAYVTYAYELARLPVAQTTSLLYLVPLVALPAAWAWRGEVPRTTALIGGAVTLVGVALVQMDGPAAPAPEDSSSHDVAAAREAA